MVGRQKLASFHGVVRSRPSVGYNIFFIVGSWGMLRLWVPAGNGSRFPLYASKSILLYFESGSAKTVRLGRGYD
jgi:hypothetical protein